MAPVNGGFQLALDTADRPDLRPQSPSHRYALANTDELFVFDQTFEQRKVKKRRHRAPAPPFRITK
jgi:hypothetical protein